MEQPTGFVGERIGPEDREPELLTHHEHNGTGRDDLGYDVHDDRWPEEADQELHESGYDDEDDGKKGKPPLTPRQRKKRRWRRIRRTMYVLAGLFIVLPAIAFTITYFLVDVPTPEEVAAEQNKVVTYLYSNGQEMGRDVPPGGNRVILEYNQIPEVTRKAVYATEDNTFETNSGFDITGIMRAVWNQVSGGAGGGSTISQQYIKVATENDEYSYTRKALELVKSFKMNQEQSKQDIITAYLNTIYFGRGAYGIQTAAQAFYGKNASELNVSESALLAGLIQQPGRSENMEVAHKRWNTALDRMVANGWLSKAERAKQQFPKMIPLEDSKPDTMTGPARLIRERVKAELEARGYPEEKIQAGGYKVHTTIDPKAQKLAEDAVNEVMKGQPEKLKEALVAVDPKTGGVRAYYGGPGVVDNKLDLDWANVAREPGSSYKVFDLVALLQRGKGLGEVYDGSSPRTIQGAPVRNSGNVQCKRCTVAEAMERSINTVFYDMVANDTGVQGVVDAARAAGIPEKHGDTKTMANPDNNISIGGGATLVTTADMAGAYATFAAEGVHRDQHFVTKLEKPDGELVFETPVEDELAFAPEDAKKNAQIAGNVTKSLEPVLPYSKLACRGGRDCAGKTGTHQYVNQDGSKDVNENAQAWMVGYNPQIATAVWVGTEGNNKIRDAQGRRIYGKDLPGEIWKKFMDGYLEDKPRVKFPEVKLIGKAVEKPQETTSRKRETTTAPPPTSSTEPPTSSNPPTSSSDNDETSTETEPSFPGLPRPPTRDEGLFPGREDQ